MFGKTSGGASGGQLALADLDEDRRHAVEACRQCAR
jgi:hypothetical protein